ncbi:uncharacterized protein LOC110931789 [Helianthus annuus]|uniref:uncharacterized protein LOC110931789 n=1 Tax=Helianthus annuus TaxID=4232 RepID=UPI000B8FF465|nr:uncharacterized protein LOC110931789 [Helianthus annuus]
METHVDSSKVYEVCKKVFHDWSWASNASCCMKGTRIIIGWDANVVDVMILDQSDQVIHTQIMFKVDKKSFFCSFIYADNNYKNRRILWQNLYGHHSFIWDKPWGLMGDFNAATFLEDSLSGSSSTNIASREFKECLEKVEVFDVNCYGLHFTWTNRRDKGDAVYKKIDRILGNVHLIDAFPAAAAYFHPYRISDHTPCFLLLPNVARDRPKPFKFVNLLAEKDGFLDEVKQVWSKEVDGFRMFQVVNKLRMLKTPLRKLFYKLGNLHGKVVSARKALDDCQISKDADPLNNELNVQHGQLLQEYKDDVHDKSSYLQQKSKVEWLSLGDTNSKYFHNIVKAKNHKSRIFAIRDVNGILHKGGMVPKALVDHFSMFFGSVGEVSMQPAPDLFRKVLSDEKAMFMARDITDEEIKGAMFAIAGNKAPGPDGFTSVFFKKILGCSG